MHVPQKFVLGLSVACFLASDLQAATIGSYEELIITIKDSIHFDNISYLYEGSYKRLDDVNGERVENKSKSYMFNGYYLTRLPKTRQRPNAKIGTYLDVYRRNFDNMESISRTTIAQLGDVVHKLNHPQNRKASTQDILARSRSHASLLNVHYSPDLYFKAKEFFCEFDETNSLQANYFAFKKPETLNDVVCTVFDIDAGRGTKTEGKMVQRFWLDSHHDCIILKYERFINGKLAERIDQLDIRQFKANSQESGREIRIWYPIKASFVSYINGPNGIAKEPQSIAAISVLANSVDINSPVTDDMFSIFYQPGFGKSDHMARLEREFRSALSRRNGPAKSIDVVAKDLERQIAEAEAKSKEWSVQADMQSGELFSSRFFVLAGVVAALLCFTTAGVLFFRRSANRH